jgi:two-component system, NtrC family, nitrogen regulation sensor histidine kinase NtrY
MRLRYLYIIYLSLIHFAFIAMAWRAFSEEPLWLLAVEGFFIASFIVAFWLQHRFFQPLELVRSGAQFIRESDFNAKLLRIGQPEMDAVIDVYNDMMQSLHEERVQIAEQQSFLNKLINASPAGILTLDFDGNINQVNPAATRLLDMSEKEIVGKSLRRLPLSVAEPLHRLAVGESSVLVLGSRRRVKCAKSEFIDKGFRREFFVLEELTDELRRSEKIAYEKVIRLLSHEVNNTTGATRSLLQSCLTYSVQLTSEDKIDFEQALHIAIGRTESLSAFMRSYAEIIKLPPPKLQSCDLEEMLRRITKLFQQEMQRRSIEMRFRITGYLETVPMDRAQMEQVFINILKNAIEAIGNDGAITIYIERQSRKTLVSIEDTGGGISEAAKQNLFTPFFSTKEGGQGLGLTLIQEILTNHAFEFSLDSTDRHSTVFKIIFE